MMTVALAAVRGRHHEIIPTTRRCRHRNSAFELLGRDGYANSLVKDRIACEIDTDEDLDARVASSPAREIAADNAF
jgi:hypothetical protein